MKVGENPLYIMLARHLGLVTEVVLKPTSPFTINDDLRFKYCKDEY